MFLGTDADRNQEGENAVDERAVPENENNDSNNDSSSDPNTTPLPTPESQTPPLPPRPSALQVFGTFIRTFVTSLIPTAPPPIQQN